MRPYYTTCVHLQPSSVAVQVWVQMHAITTSFTEAGHVEQGHGRSQPATGLQDMPQLWWSALICKHLSPIERLQLCRASSGLAGAVLQQTSHVQLRLSLHHEHLHSSRQIHAHWSRLAAMMADRPPDSSLHVTISDGVPTVWNLLPRTSITHITLMHMDFTAAVLQRLQLQQCTHLHTLSLSEGCGFPSREDADDLAALSPQRAALFPPSLTCLDLSDSGLWCEDAIDQLLGPQITTLYSHDEVPPSFSQLTHYHCKRPVLDSMLDSLCAAPRLTHITGRYLHLTKAVPPPRHKWQQLLLEEGAHLSALLHLPLQHIERVTVCRKLLCDVFDDGGVHVLGNDTRLECMPQHVPGLEQSVMVLAGRFTPAVVKLCADTLTHNGCLCLVDFDPPTIGVLDCLAQLSYAHKVTAVGLASWQMADTHHTDDQLAHYWQQVVAALPEHIECVLLEFMLWPDGCCHHAEFLLAALAASRRHQHIRVVIVMSHGGCMLEQLQRLMVKYAPRVLTVSSTMIVLRY